MCLITFSKDNFIILDRKCSLRSAAIYRSSVMDFIIAFTLIDHFYVQCDVARAYSVHLQYLFIHTERRRCWRNCWLLYDRRLQSLWRVRDYFFTATATTEPCTRRLHFIRAKNRRKYSPGKQSGSKASTAVCWRYYWLWGCSVRSPVARLNEYSARDVFINCDAAARHNLHHFPAAAAKAAQTYFTSQVNSSFIFV